MPHVAFLELTTTTRVYLKEIGCVAAVEVKLAASVASHDIKGLASLRDALGEHFVRGVIAYTGQEVMPMGDRIFAVPVGMMFAG